MKINIFYKKNLLPIIHNCGEMLEGNIFMTHNTTNYTDTFINKARNLSNMVLNKNIKIQAYFILKVLKKI